MRTGTPVVVVGAGIAGLTAAFRLHQAGCRVLVLERSSPEEIGGRMATIERGGFHIDTCATLLTGAYKQMLGLVADVGVADRVLSARRTFGVLRDGAVRRMRVEPKVVAARSGFVRGLRTSDLVKVAIDFLRIRRELGWYDMTGTASRDFESVRDYSLRRGLHPDTFEYLLAPFVAGPILAEPEEASIVSAFFTFNAIVACSGGFTSAQGVGFLPRALSDRLAVTHHAEVTSVEPRRDEVAVTWNHPEDGEHVETARQVVVAVPPPQAVDLCPQLSARLRDYLCQVRYSCSVHVAFGLDRPTAEKSLMLQVPRIEQSTMTAYVMEHNQAAGRVPPGTGLVMAHMRGSWSEANWHLDDEAAVDHALAETHGLGILPELHSNTTIAQVIRIPRGTVIRRPGEFRHAARIADELRAQAPLHFAGSDYLGLSSTNSALASGERAAADVLDTLAHGG